jgi:hypothetical protein
MVKVSFEQSRAKPGSAVDLRPDLQTASSSTAGAGSDTFSRYRKTREREMERIRSLKKDAEEKVLDEAFDRKLADARARDEDRTRKNAERRRKKRARKAAASHARDAEGDEAAPPGETAGDEVEPAKDGEETAGDGEEPDEALVEAMMRELMAAAGAEDSAAPSAKRAKLEESPSGEEE